MRERQRTEWYPGEDSNPCNRLRRPVLYPAELPGLAGPTNRIISQQFSFFFSSISVFVTHRCYHGTRSTTRYAWVILNKMER